MQEMQRHNDYRISAFPHYYYKITKNWNIRLKLQYFNLLCAKKRTSMASAISDNVNKHITTRELEAFYLRGCEYHKRAAFMWTLLVNTVNTTPFEGTIRPALTEERGRSPSKTVFTYITCAFFTAFAVRFCAALFWDLTFKGTERSWPAHKNISL